MIFLSLLYIVFPSHLRPCLLSYWVMRQTKRRGPRREPQSDKHTTWWCLSLWLTHAIQEHGKGKEEEGKVLIWIKFIHLSLLLCFITLNVVFVYHNMLEDYTDYGATEEEERREARQKASPHLINMRAASEKSSQKSPPRRLGCAPIPLRVCASSD